MRSKILLSRRFFSASSFSECIKKATPKASTTHSAAKNTHKNANKASADQTQGLPELCAAEKSIKAPDTKHDISMLSSELQNLIDSQVYCLKNSVSDQILIKGFLKYLKKAELTNLYLAIKHSQCSFKQLKNMDITTTFKFKSHYEDKVFSKGLKFLMKIDDEFNRKKISRNLQDLKKVENIIERSCLNNSAKEINLPSKINLVSSLKISTKEELNEKLTEIREANSHAAVMFIDFHFTEYQKIKRGSYFYRLIDRNGTENNYGQVMKIADTKNKHEFLANAIFKILQSTEEIKSSPLWIITDSKELLSIMKTIDNKNSKIGFEIEDNRKKLLKVIFEYRSIQFVEADSNLKELKELGEKSVKFF